MSINGSTDKQTAVYFYDGTLLINKRWGPGGGRVRGHVEAMTEMHLIESCNSIW